MKNLLCCGVLLWAALLIEGCPPMPPVVPTGDADAAGLSDNALADIALEARVPTLYTQACANLARLHCPEGLLPKCAEGMANAAVSGHFTTTPESAQCLKTAATIASVRACPGVSCLTDGGRP